MHVFLPNHLKLKESIIIHLHCLCQWTKKIKMLWSYDGVYPHFKECGHWQSLYMVAIQRLNPTRYKRSQGRDWRYKTLAPINKEDESSRSSKTKSLRAYGRWEFKKKLKKNIHTYVSVKRKKMPPPLQRYSRPKHPNLKYANVAIVMKSSCEELVTC